ncbi:hypothetical protein HDU84_009515 [Entophlyctis sp. JEL0112]|nr:hypothetical protein HDU84_009515 [Entophlyctis sp. JEL0112]
MCGNNGYASEMPAASDIIAISQTLGLQLFSSYMTASQIADFENVAAPMCLSQVVITVNGVSSTKTVYDVCDDTNGCAKNDIDFWDPANARGYCGGLERTFVTILSLYQTNFEIMETAHTVSASPAAVGSKHIDPTVWYRPQTSHVFVNVLIAVVASAAVLSLAGGFDSRLLGDLSAAVTSVIALHGALGTLLAVFYGVYLLFGGKAPVKTKGLS